MTDHHRRSIRLRDYDYTQDGAYFVTVCTHERRCLFGHVVDGAMVLNTWGHIMADEWERTAIVRPGVALDAFVVMPNHAHAVIVIMGGVDDAVGGAMHCAPTQTWYDPKQRGTGFLGGDCPWFQGRGHPPH
jgi:putative transposase